MTTKRVRRFPVILKEEDLNKILDYISKAHWYQHNYTGQFHKHRDSVAAQIMFYTGLRPAECLNLKWSDINFERCYINIDPFSNKERNGTPAVFPERCYNALIVYKKQLEIMGITCEFLFPSMWTWKPMTSDAYAKRMQRIFRETGLLNLQYYDKAGMPHYDKSPYIFRHSFGTNIYKNTGDIYQTMIALRQTTLSATARYTRLDFDAIYKTVNQTFQDHSKQVDFSDNKVFGNVYNYAPRINHNYGLHQDGNGTNNKEYSGHSNPQQSEH